MTRKPGHNEWTSQQRKALDALVALSGDWTIISNVWNSMFAEDLANCGCAPLGTSVLRSQYREKSRGAVRWNGIGQTRDWYLSQEGCALPIQLDTVARRLGFQLLPDGYSCTSRMTTTFKTSDVLSTLQSSESGHDSDTDMEIIQTMSEQLRHTSLDPESSQPQMPMSCMAHPRMNEAASSTKLTTAIRAQQRQQRLQVSRMAPHVPFIPISKEAAHPPLSTLIYRFYDIERSYGKNSPLVDGFVAGRFQQNHSGIPPPLDCTNANLFADIENHVNRNNVASPFISVSNWLPWTLRQVAKITAKTEKESKPMKLRISIIDASIAGGDGGRNAYHMRAYHKQLKERRVFTDGKWQYAGKSEILIWGKIPTEAILCDFSFEDLKKLCRSQPTLRSFFRFNILSEPGSLENIERKLKANSVDFDKSISAMAGFVTWLFSRMSLTPVVHPHHLAKLVSDMARGWHARPEETRLSTEEWAAAAEAFSTQLGRRHAGSGQRRAAIKSAFVFGMQSSYGDIDWQHGEKTRRLMLSRAQKAGLDAHAVGIVLADNALRAQELQSARQQAAILAETYPSTPRFGRSILESVLLTPPSSSGALSKLRAGYTLTEEDMVAIRLIGLE